MLAEVLVPITAEPKSQLKVVCEMDPLRSLDLAVKHAVRHGVKFSEEEDFFPVRWASLRCGEPHVLNNTTRDAFRVLEDCVDVKLWKWASSELPPQHPVTGDTLFHALCRNTKMDVGRKVAVLADLKSHFRNPLSPYRQGELCIDLAKGAKLRKELRGYMCWQPNRLVTEWFGPLFQKRAFALLLVCYRLKKLHSKQLDPLNKDMRHLLVKYLSRVEVIFVNRFK